MPHVIVKLWPGNSHMRKQRLADAIAKEVKDHLGCGEGSISIAFEEVSPEDWKEKVYEPDIAGQAGKLFKKPGYSL